MESEYKKRLLSEPVKNSTLTFIGGLVIGFVVGYAIAVHIYGNIIISLVK